MFLHDFKVHIGQTFIQEIAAFGTHDHLDGIFPEEGSEFFTPVLCAGGPGIIIADRFRFQNLISLCF
jgi:hypothetical protein